MRPSFVAVMVGEIKSSVLIIKNRESGEPILTNVTATPVLLNGQVAGGIIILKKVVGKQE